MLADARFLVGAIVVPRGAPLFQWQKDSIDGNTRDHLFQEWSQAYSQAVSPLFTGCTIEYLQPDAYYVSSREADRRIRPLALKAAITWLQTAAALPAGDLRATIAGCGESVAEEFRVGFSTRQDNNVIYGCVWPVLSKEEALSAGMDAAEAAPPDQIRSEERRVGKECLSNC